MNTLTITKIFAQTPATARPYQPWNEFHGLMSWRTLQQREEKQKQRKSFLLMALFVVAIFALATLPSYATEAKSFPVSKAEIKKGQIITKADLKMQANKHKSMPQTLIQNVNDIVGMEAVRTIRAGQPIYKSYLRISPDIHRGAEVKVSFNKGGLQLSTFAKALEDAVIGDTVRVRNQASNQVIVGTVVAENSVVVKR